MNPGILLAGGAVALFVLLSGKKSSAATKTSANILPAEGSKATVNVPPPVVVSDAEPSPTLVEKAAEVGGVVVPAPVDAAQKAAAAAAIDAVATRDWQTAVVSAIESGSAATLDTVAAAMRADGLTAQAGTVDAVAEALRTEAVAVNADAGVQVTVSEVKALEPPPVVPTPDPKIQLAKDFAIYVAKFAPYKEDRTIVKGFQMGLGLTADGMYGRMSALKLTEYGIIPPAPYYWPSTGTQTAIADYRTALRTCASLDPPRAVDWLYAADHCVR